MDVHFDRKIFSTNSFWSMFLLPGGRTDRSPKLIYTHNSSLLGPPNNMKRTLNKHVCIGMNGLP